MFKGEICFFYSIIILVGVVNEFLYTLIDRPVSTLPGSGYVLLHHVMGEKGLV